MKFYVYVWIRPDTGAVFYVGKGCRNRDCLFKSHNKIFLRIVEKLKRASLEPIIKRVAEGITELEAFDIERKLIALYGRINNNTGTLSNLTDGGQGLSGHSHSEDTKRAIGAAHRGKFVSEETRRKLGAWHRSEEFRAKISAAGKRRSAPSAETRLKTSTALLGIKRSDETRRKMSAAQTGNKKFLGRTHSAETREKMSAIMTGRKMSADARHKVTSSNRLNPPKSNNKSGFKGVCFDAESKKWKASIKDADKQRRIGYFITPEDAARAYDKAAFAAWGRDCFLNFPAELAA